MNWACRSVGKPGCGWVVSSTGRSSREHVTRAVHRIGFCEQSCPTSTCTPTWLSTLIAAMRASTGQFSSVMSPLVIAAAHM